MNPKAEKDLDFSLRFRGGETFHRWLQALREAGFADGGTMMGMFPPGVNRSPADVDDCLRDAEAAGVITPAGGFTSNRSLLAWRGYPFGGKHPSARLSTVGRSERTWRPGENADLLKAICEKPWSEYEKEGAWRSPRPVDSAARR